LKTPVLAVAALLCWNGAFLAVPTLGIWLSVGSAAVVLLAVSAWHGAPWADLLKLRRVGLGLAGALVTTLACELLAGPVLAAVPPLAEQANGLYALFGKPEPWQAWGALPFIVVSEELIFRGALLEGFRGRPMWQAWGLCTGLYAASHLCSQSWALVGLALLFGGFWTALRIKSKNLWPGLLAHLLWDLAILVIWPLNR
jgi:hypothetical protein